MHVIPAAAITVGVLFSLIIYILVNGVVHLKPELFAREYNTNNMSMMPAIISTVYITALSLLMAVPVGIFSAIYLVEYAKRGSKLVKVIRTMTETLQGSRPSCTACSDIFCSSSPLAGVIPCWPDR